MYNPVPYLIGEDRQKKIGSDCAQSNHISVPALIGANSV